MKRLVLVRHAKAVPWGYDDDYHRELTGRGENDARKVSTALKNAAVLPDLIISSPAARALQTAEIFAGIFGYPDHSLVKNQALYDGMTTGELVDLVRHVKDETGCVFLFGHNPSCGFFARGLCRDFSDEMPTCSSVVIDFQIDHWAAVSAG
jgi:phosphohistidine phosphatase